MPFRTQDELSRIKHALNSVSVGIWQWDIKTGNEWWTDTFYTMLGYEPGELEPSYHTFITELAHPDHVERIEKAIASHLEHQTEYRLSFQMKKKSGDYLWVLASGEAVRDENGTPVFMAGSNVDIEREVHIQQELEKNQLFLEETGSLAKAGGWEVDIVNMTTQWSKAVYDIHEVPYDEVVPVEEAIDFFHDDDKERISTAFGKAISEKLPYSDTYRIITRSNKEIYVHAVGLPVLNEAGEVISVRGVFQDIDDRVRSQLLTEDALATSTEQNQRLVNFAHIVSHNLRNHTGNLEMLLSFLKDSKDEKDREDLIDKLNNVVGSLSETLTDLNDIITVQNQQVTEVQEVDFTAIAHKIVQILAGDIERLEAKVEINLPPKLMGRFSQIYADSVLLNLVSNAIRYRSPERRLTIQIDHDADDKYINIHVKDNGLGIDLELHKNRIFKMYGTIHTHPDSRGVGLFLIKNQLESSGGAISVESTPDVGTTFTIHIPRT